MLAPASPVSPFYRALSKTPHACILSQVTRLWFTASLTLSPSASLGSPLHWDSLILCLAPAPSSSIFGLLADPLLCVLSTWTHKKLQSLNDYDGMVI